MIKSWANDNLGSKRILGLKQWLTLQGKDYDLCDAILCIFNTVGGNANEACKVIDILVDYNKRMAHGRSRQQDLAKPPMTIENNNGKLVLVGYSPEREIEKRNKGLKNPKKVNKARKNRKEVLTKVGQVVRKAFPGATVDEIADIERAVNEYARKVKKSNVAIVEMLVKGKLKFDSGSVTLVPFPKSKKTIKLKESVASEVSKEIEMTEWKFVNGLKHFLAKLLEDPVNTKPDDLFSVHGLDRISLLRHLLDRKMIKRVQSLCDKDENGKPKTATMKVKYLIPRKDFDKNVKKMYIELFESDDVEECASCGSAGVDGGNTISTPLFGVCRRKIMGEGKTGVDNPNASAAVYIFCRNNVNKWCVMAAKRGEGSYSGVGKLNPPMGHIHVDERPIEGAVRECFEESGVRVDVGSLKEMPSEKWGKGKIGYNFVWVVEGKNTDDIRIGNGDGENERFGWIEVNAIKPSEWAFSTGNRAIEYACEMRAENELDEATTGASVGNFQYDAPVFGDLETLSRPKGGICVNFANNNRKKS